MIVPTFEECERISRADQFSSSCGCASEIVRANDGFSNVLVYLSGTMNLVEGVILPSCSAAMNVTSLNVEPGS